MAEVTGYTKTQVDTLLGDKADALGPDDHYVTDVEKTALANLGTAAAAAAEDFAPAGSAVYPVQQVELTEDIPDYTLPLDAPLDQVISVVFTQDAIGGHTVTFGGQPVEVDLTAGASTLVEVWPGSRVVYSAAEPLSSTYATLTENFAYPAYSFTAKLETGGQDVTLLNLSDSTGSSTTGYFSQTLDWLGAQYPEFSTSYHDWDHTTNTWFTADDRTTGTNGFTIHAWNGGYEGTTYEYPLPFLQDMVGLTQPDLVLINYGHNNGALNTAFEAHIARLVGSIQQFAPRALIVICSQNPRLDGVITEANSQARANINRDMARLIGCGFVDWYTAFIDTGAPADYIEADLIHPNAAGHALMASKLEDFLRWRPQGQPLQQPPGLFLTSARNLVRNGSFAAWATSPGAPDGWTESGLTSIEKDSAGEYESANGYAAKMVMSGAAAGRISATIKRNNVRGKWITAAARFYIPAGSHANAGKLQLGSTTSLGSSTTSTVGGWKWEVVSRFYPIDYASDTTLNVYASTTSAATGTVWCDRVFVCEGLLPHDVS